MKTLLALLTSVFLGLSATASAHDGCDHGKKSSCCTAKAGKSCCHGKAVHSGHCRARSIFGFNGLGNPVKLRPACPKSSCKMHGTSGGCCASQKKAKCCKAKTAKSACPYLRAQARAMKKSGCCSH